MNVDSCTSHFFWINVMGLLDFYLRVFGLLKGRKSIFPAFKSYF